MRIVLAVLAVVFVVGAASGDVHKPVPAPAVPVRFTMERVHVVKSSTARDLTLQIVARGDTTRRDHVLIATQRGRAPVELVVATTRDGVPIPPRGDDNFVEDLVHDYVVSAAMRADGSADVELRLARTKLDLEQLRALASGAPGVDRAKLFESCATAAYRGAGRATVVIYQPRALVVQLGAYSGTIIATADGGTGPAGCTPRSPPSPSPPTTVTRPVGGSGSGMSVVSTAAIKKRALPKGNYGSIDASHDYPAAARKAGVEGTIRVKLVVDDKGAVRSATLLNKLGHGLDELALDRARKIRFEPALDMDDKPITSIVIWTFNMTLPK